MLKEQKIGLALAKNVKNGEKRGCETMESLCALDGLLSLAPPKEIC